MQITNKRWKNAVSFCYKMHKSKLLCNYLLFDHSKHINDNLRCGQYNGATCLNCKFLFIFLPEMLTAAQTPSSYSSFFFKPFTFEMQAA